MKFIFLILSFLPFVVFSQEVVKEEEVLDLAYAPYVPMLDEMMDRLGITGDLKTKIEDLWYQHQKEMLDLRYQIEKKEIELFEIVKKDDFNPDKFIQSWKEIQKLKNDAEFKRLNFKISVYKMLPKEKAKEVKRWLFSEKGEIRKRIVKKVMDMREEHKCTKEQKMEHKCMEK